MTDSSKPVSRWSDGRLYAATIDRLLSGLRSYIADRLPDGHRVLDACCGTGALALQLARQGRRVVGIDRSPRQIAWARRQAAEAGLGPEQLRFTVGDVAALEQVSAQGPFDAAVIVMALHEMPAPMRLSVLATLTSVAPRVMIVDFAAPMPWNLPGVRNRAAEVVGGPEHFRGFRDYTRRGGLSSLVDTAGLKVERDRTVDGDTLRVITVSRAA